MASRLNKLTGQENHSNQPRWSESLQSWYIVSEENGRLVAVLPDRRRIFLTQAPPSASQPRSSSTRQPNPSTYNASNQAYGPAAYGHYVPGPPGPAQLTNQIGGLGLGTSSTSPPIRRGDASESSASVRENRSPWNVVSRLAMRNGQLTLLGSDGDEEELDQRYKKRPDARRFFRVGRVFFTLWTEPSTSEGTDVSIVRYGERAYSQIRRFVVTREGETFCEAVPILTYGGQATLKRGVTRSQHALIYTGNRPNLLQGETGLVETAIAVSPDDGETLDPRSRVNLGTPYTIQHNLKVKPCGMVRNIDALLDAVDRARGQGRRLQAREAGPSQNTPVSPAGPVRNDPRGPRGVSMPSGGRGIGRGAVAPGYNIGAGSGPGPGQPSNPVRRGVPDGRPGHTNPGQYGASSQAIQQARARMQAEAQVAAEDDSEDDEDEEEDDDDNDAAQRRQDSRYSQYSQQPRRQ